MTVIIFLLNEKMRTWIVSLTGKFRFISHRVDFLSNLLMHSGSFTMKKQRVELIIKAIFSPADVVKL